MDEGGQMRTAAPAVRRTDISTIAYGFMASQALFAALEIDLFSRLEDGPRRTDELAAATGVAPNRLQTLLHALAGLGLLVAEERGYANAPAYASLSPAQCGSWASCW
jgi:2-hydroxy-4-(methylsulfanyl)butanoate S-methyltransferase